MAWKVALLFLPKKRTPFSIKTPLAEDNNETHGLKQIMG